MVAVNRDSGDRINLPQECLVARPVELDENGLYAEVILSGGLLEAFRSIHQASNADTQQETIEFALNRLLWAANAIAAGYELEFRPSQEISLRDIFPDASVDLSTLM